MMWLWRNCTKLMAPSGSLKENVLFSWHKQLFYFSAAPSFIACRCLWLSQRPRDMWLLLLRLCLLRLHWSAHYSTPLYMNHTWGQVSLHPDIFGLYWLSQRLYMDVGLRALDDPCFCTVTIAKFIFYVTAFGPLVSLFVGHAYCKH